MKLTLFFIFISFCATTVAGEIQIEQRELKIKNFPCMDCHSNIKNTEVNFPLKKPHDNIILDHMDSVKNCFKCHDQKNRHLLILQTGEKIGFNESYRQCFQCHGMKKRDWLLGIHGKMVGSWNGKKYKYTCVNCHDPHHPKFRQMKADPGPVHPRGEKMHEGTH